MEKPETLATLGTQDTGDIRYTRHSTKINNTTQKTKNMSNTCTPKPVGEPRALVKGKQLLSLIKTLTIITRIVKTCLTPIYANKYK